MSDKPKSNRGGKREGSGRPPIDPKDRRKATLNYFHPNTLLYLDLCRTFAPNAYAVSSRSKYIEWLIWTYGDAPGYDKIIKQPDFKVNIKTRAKTTKTIDR